MTNADQSNNADERFMRVALDLAASGQGNVEPNPMVGCVIVRDNEIVGKGFHGKFGGPHAEVAAINSLGDRQQAKGATAYVTLEPCCHQGKTPPCTDALIDAGVGRVVIAVKDPFPKVDGGGIARLADAGIETTTGVLAEDATQLLAPYLKKVQRGQPWVIAKWAMTADGRIATVIGESQWITGPESLKRVHQLRGRVDAIMVGMGTVVSDDPQLTARPPGARTATRVAYCRHRLPDKNSQLVQTANEVPTLLIVASAISERQIQPLIEHGVTVFRCRTNDPVEMIGGALDYLGKSEMTNVMLEGGGELLGSFLLADQIDECHVYIGSKLFGGTAALSPIGGRGLEKLSDSQQVRLMSVDSFGSDVRLVYRRV